MLFVRSVGVEQFYNLVNHAVGRLGKEHVLDGIGVPAPAGRAEDEAHLLKTALLNAHTAVLPA